MESIAKFPTVVRRNLCLTLGVLPALIAGAGCASRTLGEGFVLAPERVVDETQRRAKTKTPVIVLDARPLDQYRAAHLEGALWLDLTTWSRLSRSFAKGFADTAGWRKRIGDLGIAADDAVLVYDGGEMTEAARVWYILQLFGAKNVAVLDGGYPALSDIAPPEKLVDAIPPIPLAKEFKPPPASLFARGPAQPAAKLADKALVRSAISGKRAKIVDVRTRAEYEGRDRKNNPRSGHLPDAINIPHSEMLDARGQLRAVSELKKLFTDAGLKPGDAIITHCQSGGQAALAALAAKRAGFADVSNYYLGFSEWAHDESCPLDGESEARTKMTTDGHR